MLGTLFGYLIASGLLLAAAGPFVCLFFLTRHFTHGTRLPADAVAAVYLGCLLWIVIIAGRSALVPAWRPFVGLPILVGVFLGPAWEWKAAPPPTAGRAMANAAVFAVFGLMGVIALGGGYFDKVFQVPHARTVLRKTGVKPDDAAALARALRDDDVWVRWGAASALGSLGPGAAPALDSLVAAVEDPDARVGRSAWSAIHRLGPLAAPAAPAIAALLKKGRDDWDVRRYFESLGPKTEAAVPTLLALAEDPSAQGRAQALEALGCVGPGAEAAALPVLVRIYKSEKDPGVKDAASRIHPKLGITFAEWQQALSAHDRTP